MRLSRLGLLAVLGPSLALGATLHAQGAGEATSRPLLVGLGASAAALAADDGPGFGAGGQLTLLGRRPQWPLLARVELAHTRLTVEGDPCGGPLAAGCDSGRPLRLTSGLLGVLTAPEPGRRAFLSAAAGVVAWRQAAGDRTMAALAGGVGVGSLGPGQAGLVELRLVWLRDDRGTALLAPIAFTLLW